MCKIANKAKNLTNKVSLEDVIKIADVCRKSFSGTKKIFPGRTIFGTRITLTNNEIKGITKLIKCLEKKRNFIKRNY